VIEPDITLWRTRTCLRGATEAGLFISDAASNDLTFDEVLE